MNLETGKRHLHATQAFPCLKKLKSPDIAVEAFLCRLLCVKLIINHSFLYKNQYQRLCQDDTQKHGQRINR